MPRCKSDRATSLPKPAWRAACLAYREKRRADASERSRPAGSVAAAVQGKAGQETTNAIAYASRHHSEWFWRGVVSLRVFPRTKPGLSPMQMDDVTPHN
jgi:hypothetical protein